MRVLYFFLSYARGDDDVFVEQFYKDLCDEVRMRAGIGADQEVGFVDTHSIEVGAAWPTRLVGALSQCRSFIALCSPRYFLSEACGKEWWVFADRVHQYIRATGEQPSALLPLIWLPVRRMHAAAAEIQYHADALGDVYRRDGLRQLMRLQRHRDAYLEFISALATRIVETSDSHPVPRNRLRLAFEQIPSKFHADPVSGAVPAPRATAEPPAPADPADPAPMPANPQHVHFIVAAPSRTELATVRSNLAFYGDQASDWAPYQPTLSSPLVDFARKVAARRSFASDVDGIGALSRRMAQAARANQIVVLLVDAWVTRLNEHRRMLSEYSVGDPLDEAATAVMIPGSHEDIETQEHWRQLSDSLRSIFLNRIAGGDEVMFRSNILTHRAFDEDLQVVLEVARNRLFTRGHVFRRAPADSVGERPILEGPWHPDSP